jgi:hypothetical protein
MSHDTDTADLRARLGQTSGMMANIAAQHQEITKGATARLAQVEKQLEALRPKVILDHGAADEYMELTREKGALLRALVGYSSSESAYR